MKIFISWSGARSKAVAELMSEWIRCVIQATRPWVSSRDIDRGSLWFSEISDALSDVAVGIVCITQENKDKPWILFEAGALSKGLSTQRVCTFLVDLEPSDLRDPLAQFNHTLPQKSNMHLLVRTLNSYLGDQKLEDQILDDAFEMYWPSFQQKFSSAVQDNPVESATAPREDSDILSEILNSTRSLGKRMRDLETYVYVLRQSPPMDVEGSFSLVDSMFDSKVSEQRRELAQRAQFEASLPPKPIRIARTGTSKLAGTRENSVNEKVEAEVKRRGRKNSEE